VRGMIFACKRMNVREQPAQRTWVHIMQHKLLNLALLTGLSLSGAAQAALHDRGGGLIYDDVLNVTWLQNANYGAGSSYDNGSNTTDGLMKWGNAVAWADTLVFHDSVRNVDYSDWRLPTMVDTGTPGLNWANSGTDTGYNVQTVSGGTVYSELAHMYFNNLGLTSRYSPAGDYQPDFGIFGNGTTNGVDLNSPAQNDVGLIQNLGPFLFWTGLEYAPNSNAAWVFRSDYGIQNAYYKNENHGYAWAVRDGDVAAVPEADTWAMLLAGLGLVGVATRRRCR
jgi:hypothetical protein